MKSVSKKFGLDSERENGSLDCLRTEGDKRRCRFQIVEDKFLRAESLKQMALKYFIFLKYKILCSPNSKNPVISAKQQESTPNRENPAR